MKIHLKSLFRQWPSSCPDLSPHVFPILYSTFLPLLQSRCSTTCFSNTPSILSQGHSHSLLSPWKFLSPDNHVICFPMSLGELLKSETQLYPNSNIPLPPLYHPTLTLLSLLITYYISTERINPLTYYLFILHIVCPTHPPLVGLGLTILFTTLCAAIRNMPKTLINTNAERVTEATYVKC